MESLPIELNNQEQRDQAQLLRLTVKRENVEYIEKYSKQYLDNLFTAICYIHDLSGETQNLLLGSIFDNVVPKRKPLDKNLKVITTKTEDFEILEKYFTEESSWGQEMKKYT